MYVSAGLCATTNKAVLCIGLWGNMALSCVTATAPGGILPFTGSTIYVGDPDYSSIAGYIRNVRLFSGTCFDTVQANTQYIGIKDYCMPGCVHCISPDACDLSDYGYYLDSYAQCQRCHSCCNGCTGAGYDHCLTCTHTCTLIDTDTCVRKRYIGCHKSCASCHGPRIWECNSCQAGLYKQPNNPGLCLSTCPTGFTPLSGQCQGTPSLAVSLPLDYIGSSLQDQANLFAVYCGRSGNCDVGVDPTAPVPVKDRGYHFNGQQYLKIGYNEARPSVYLLLVSSFSLQLWFNPEILQTSTLFTKGVTRT